jgi:hypothetical protein
LKPDGNEQEPDVNSISPEIKQEISNDKQKTHLVGQLAGVAQYEHGHDALFRLELVERREHKHGRLSHPRLGLANHVHAHDGRRDGLVLDLRGVLKRGVDDGAVDLGLEQKVLKGRRVDATVARALLLRPAPGCGAAVGVRQYLLFLVVDKILFGGVKKVSE